MNTISSSKLTILTSSILMALCNSAYAENEQVVVNKVSNDLILQCTKVTDNVARLACFDKVTQQNVTPNFVENKAPLDVERTIKSTISGKPELVLVDTNELNNDKNQLELSDIEPLQTEVSQELPEKEPMKGILAGSYNRLTDFFADKNESKNATLMTVSDLDEELLAELGVTKDELGEYSALSLAYDLDKNNEVGTWKPRIYNPIYILPVYAYASPNRNPSTPTQEAVPMSQNDFRAAELKMQLSVKTKMAEDLFDTRSDLWFGYTQQSHWQVYNEDNSRPFRATDYMPEVFITQPAYAPLPFDGRLRMLGAGFIHHSNGEKDPLSRSWNRVYVMAGAEWDKLTVIPTLWTRVNTDTTSKKDDNPDIVDYYGYGDLKLLYDVDEKTNLSSTLRYNPATQKGAIELGYTRQLDNNMDLYIQMFHGYGESIIDYNHGDTSVGVGLTLNDWSGL